MRSARTPQARPSAAPPKQPISLRPPLTCSRFCAACSPAISMAASTTDCRRKPELESTWGGGGRGLGGGHELHGVCRFVWLVKGGVRTQRSALPC